VTSVKKFRCFFRFSLFFQFSRNSSSKTTPKPPSLFNSITRNNKNTNQVSKAAAVNRKLQKSNKLILLSQRILSPTFRLARTESRKEKRFPTTEESVVSISRSSAVSSTFPRVKQTKKRQKGEANKKKNRLKSS
jgi:hypothetical protein